VTACRQLASSREPNDPGSDDGGFHAARIAEPLAATAGDSGGTCLGKAPSGTAATGPTGGGARWAHAPSQR
jgi:hypothetical protein